MKTHIVTLSGLLLAGSTQEAADYLNRIRQETKAVQGRFCANLYNNGNNISDNNKNNTGDNVGDITGDAGNNNNIPSAADNDSKNQTSSKDADPKNGDTTPIPFLVL